VSTVSSIFEIVDESDLSILFAARLNQRRKPDSFSLGGSGGSPHAARAMASMCLAMEESDSTTGADVSCILRAAL
jgi:hypothetical protein